MRSIILLIIVFFAIMNPLLAQNITFSDPNFKQAIIDNGVDINIDGEISYTEAQLTGFLDISNYGIYSIDEIVNFYNLTDLDCSNNNIGWIFQWPPDLFFLDVSYNNFTELDFSGISNLNNLNCSNNNLNTIVLPQTNNLHFFNCSNNIIETLYIKNHSNLSYLNISNLPTLTLVCVWQLPFPVAGLTLIATGSPNIVFETACCPTVSQYTIIKASCPETSNGKIYVNIQFGNSPYQYSIDNGIFQTSNLFSNLNSGYHIIKVKDNLNCIYTDSVYLGLNAYSYLDLGNDTTICSYDSILINASNNFVNYTWSTGASTANITINNPDIYSVTVTSSLGCIQSDSIKIETTSCIFTDNNYSCIDYIWGRSFGGTNTENLTSANEKTFSVSAGNNNTVVVGGLTLSPSMNFDGNIVLSQGSGIQEIFCSKYDSVGNFLWGKITKFPSSGCQYGTVKSDENGNTYISFSASGLTFEFNGQLYQAGSGGIGFFFLAKLDANGNTVWVKQCLGGGTGIKMMDLEIDSFGNIYGTGVFYFDGFIVDNDTILNYGNLLENIFLMKLSSNGNIIWWRSIGGQTGRIEFPELDIDLNGQLYITASVNADLIYFSDTETIAGTSGQDAQIIVKYDSNGNRLWSKIYSGIKTYSKTQIAVDSLENIYISGQYTGTSINLGGNILTSRSPSLTDIYLAKLNTSGNVIWAKDIGTTNDDTPYKLTIKYNNIYMSGTSGTDYIYIGNDIIDVQRSSFLTKLDFAGNLKWFESYYAGYLFDHGNNNIIYNYGLFNSTISFDSDIFNTFGNQDLYLNQIIENEDPAPFVIDTLFCTGNSIWIDAGAGYSNYNWSDGNESSVNEITINDTITWQVVDNIGCHSSLNTLIVNEVPNPLVDIGSDTTFCENIQTVLYAGNEFVQYNWNNGLAFIDSLLIIQSDNYYVMVTDSNGCIGYSDTVSVIINPLPSIDIGADTIVCNDISIFAQSGLFYLWSTGESTQNIISDGTGIYSITVTDVNNCHKTDSIFITVNPDYLISQFISICSNDSIYLQNDFQNQTGYYYDTLITQCGNDSIIETQLTVYSSYNVIEQIAICDNDSISWQGSTYTTAGTYFENYNSINGCDSIYILNLIITPSYSFTENYTICNGESYNWHVFLFSNSGIYYDSLLTVNGCDSLFELNLSVVYIDTSLTISDPTVFANTIGTSYQWIDCDNGLLPISGEVNQSFTATINGNYAVIITQGLCSDTSSCVYITTVGVTIPLIEKTLIYPNPVTNELTIENKGSNNKINFEILNSIGQIVFKGNFTIKTIVATTNFSEGVYLIKLDNGNTYEFNKVVKE